ncbi:MAG TPA: hypothetical protein VI818_04390, partial [Candidatus Thermoplasmatota archaeon]|nr:hypothetical protein [Candidatus Thermoplasmatota archaeon]
ATLTAPPYASPGDVVDATGVVQRKGTRIALRIEHPDDVIVRIPWYDQHEPLRRLAQRPWELRDARVVTSGAYVRSGVSQFFEDDGHRVRAFGPALLPFESGVRLRVDGVVEYDEATFAFRLRVEDARLA